jgi:uncharacterized membrane protein YphA (DoxX/SURF4 family)
MDALRSAATAPWVQSLALLCLCAAYLQGGWHKARDFRGAVAEVKTLGLIPAAPIAAAVLVLQLAASALILTGWYRWLGALAGGAGPRRFHGAGGLAGRPFLGSAAG